MPHTLIKFTLTARDIKRFWRHVKKGSSCWEWVASKTESGYGYFMLASFGNVRAHRAAYLIANGNLPEGRLVCHRCDNPSCVRPKHLFLGSYADNNLDKAQKGRSKRGELHHNARLTEKQVRQIRVARGTQKSIAQQFNIKPATVSNIRTGATWAWL